MLAQIETVAIPSIPTIRTSVEYFESVGLALTNNNFRRLFLDMEVPEAAPSEIQVHPLEKDEYAGKAFSEIHLPSLTQFCYFLSLKRGSGEWFATKLLGRDKCLYTASAVWGSDMTGDPFWEVACPPLMTPERLCKGVMIVSLK